MNIYLELFVVPLSGTERYLLIFGYGQESQTDVFAWRSERLTTGAQLRVARAALPVWAAVGFVGALSKGEDVVIDSREGVLVIEGNALVKRPTILRHPRLDATEFDASYCSQLCEVTEYWLIDKARVLASLRGEKYSSVEASARLDEAVRAIAAEVGRDFLTRASAALGNFEVFVVRPRLYKWRPIDGEGGPASGISLEIVRGLASEISNLEIMVRLQNAQVTTLYTMLSWCRGGEPVLLRSGEPLSCVEVMIFANGRLLDHGIDCRFTSVSLASAFVSGVKAINDPWSRRVGAKAGKAGNALVRESRVVDMVGHAMSFQIGEASPLEPWQPLSIKKSLLVDHEHNTLFLPNESAAEELKRLKMIVGLFDSSEVRRAVLVDPYLGKGAMSLLARVGHQCHVDAVTHIEADKCAELCELLASKSLLVSHPLRVLRSQLKFHDRYLIVERDGEEEVYVVSNSFAPVGPNDPIVVVRAAGEGRAQIVEYVKLLMRDAEVIWPLPTSGEPAANEHDDDRLVAEVLGSPEAHARSLAAAMGGEVWTKLALYLDTGPPVGEACRVLQYLRAHTTAPDPQPMSISETAAVVLGSACQELIVRAVQVPYTRRYSFHSPIETWLELLRYLVSDCDQNIGVSRSIGMMYSLSARFDVEYGLRLGIELMCLWIPDTLRTFLVTCFRLAAATFEELSDDQDPSNVRTLVTGAVLLRQLYAFAWRPEATEIFLDSSQSEMKRLGLIALFGHRFSELSVADKVARALLAGVPDLEIAHALTVRHTEDDDDHQRERIANLTRILPRIQVSSLPDILTTMSLEQVAALPNDLSDYPRHASRIHEWVHVQFERRVETMELGNMSASAFNQWSPWLAARSAVARGELEAFDALNHVVRFARRMGMRAYRHGLPREQALHYHEWSGTFVLVKVVTCYVSEVYFANASQTVPAALRPVLAGFLSVLQREPPHRTQETELVLLRRMLAQVDESERQ